MLNLLRYAALLCFFVFPNAAQAQNNWFAAPLDTATLAVSGLLTILTIPQLIVALSFLFRSRGAHFLPGMVMTVAILFIFLGYALSVVKLIIDFTSWGSELPETIVLGVNAVQALFAEWPDALVFLAVAFIIRDRYFTYKGQSWDERRSSLPLIVMMSILGIISFLVFVATSAYAGVALSPPQ
ncbi:hypothetical protein M422DRAFT_780772, partial [Sphaerobolus stellatus SS14]